MVPGQQPEKRQSLSRGLADAGSLLWSRVPTPAPITASGVALRYTSPRRAGSMWTNNQQLNFSIYHRFPQLLHLLPPSVICESHCMETQECCRDRAPVEGRVWPQQIYEVPSLWHVALGMELSSCSRVVLQHLSFGFRRDTSSPSVCKQTLANTCRKLETASLGAANTPNQSCGEYARPWL